MKYISAVLVLGVCFAANAQDKNELLMGDAALPRDAIFDEGSIMVDSTGNLSRVEDFVIFKRPDGGYTILSNISADDGTYAATASWTYDAAWRAKAAAARSKANGVERKIDIRRDDNKVLMKRTTIDKNRDMKLEEWEADCGDDCLIDMTPAVLPMTIMPRRFDAAQGGAQVFKWVGVSLINDHVLTDGKATITQAKTFGTGNLGQITHWRFVEDLKDPAGNARQMHAHLWTDIEGHLRKFGMGFTPKPNTIGIRQTDEAYSAQMPAE
jgi:hypothetical protein